jgi:hypothetical protein
MEQRNAFGPPVEHPQARKPHNRVAHGRIVVRAFKSRNKLWKNFAKEVIGKIRRAVADGASPSAFFLEFDQKPNGKTTLKT